MAAAFALPLPFAAAFGAACAFVCFARFFGAMVLVRRRPGESRLAPGAAALAGVRAAVASWRAAEEAARAADEADDEAAGGSAHALLQTPTGVVGLITVSNCTQ